MTTNRKRRTRGSQTLSGSAEMHLLTGCCLIGCELCSGGRGMSAPLGIQAWTLTENAPELWEHHRESLLTMWRDPNGRQAGASNFRGDGYRGAGRLGLPCWAEIKFEKAKLPKFDKAWPGDVKEAWRHLRDEMEVNNADK